jgi:hypothetical protein
MKRLALLLLLLPLASGALFAQTTYSITGTVPSTGTVGVSFSASLQTSPQSYAAWSYTGSLPPGLSMTTGSAYAASITGTPTTAGNYSFTVQASIGVGANGIQVTHAYTVVIAAAQVPPVSISTTSLPNGAVGVSYSQGITATGGYGLGTYTYTLTQGSLPPGLQLNASSGVIYGTPTTAGSFNFTVQVASQSGTSSVLTAYGAFSINIPLPPLTITTSSLPAGTVGVPYSQALTATAGTPAYTWRLTSGTLPGGLTLAPPGTISGTPNAAGSFTFQVTVGDSQQASASATFTVRITAAALIITTSSVPAGTVGVAYAATGLAAAGGVPPYTWSVAAGAFPGGLSISPAGVISGTPTASGTFSVTVKVTDSAQVTATQAYSITVAAASGLLSITTQPPLPGGQAGVAYTETFAATGGVQPYNWELFAGALPPGLSLSVLTGSLTGTPTAAGTFNFTVQVVDYIEHTATQPFSIAVIAAVKIITPPVMPDGTTGTLYSQQFLATGGVTPYTWSVAAGSIPTGLTLSTSTGSLSGTPTTAGTFNFTIGVTDQSKESDSAAYTIKIVAPLSITTQPPLPAGVVGAAYSQTFAATGGTTPYQWFVSTGTALPTGLTLSATAATVTGTPTAAGTFNFTIQVVDASGRSATASFTITVTAALTITTATLPNATVGTPYSQTLAAAGANGTLTWSVSTGALPAGITLNSSTGALTGTPTAPGAFTFTVNVAFGTQPAATQSLTITVGVPTGPPASITGLPATASPATQPALGITIPSAYPLAITGTVTLTFAPDAPSPDGQEVVFTTGGRTVSFTVPANTTQVVFSGATPAVQTGTVSGTITLTLKLTAAGIDVTPSSVTPITLKIAKAAPVIVSGGVTVTPTTGGFNIVVVGYATSREMLSATVTFTAASGVTLSSSSATISLASVFTTWYSSSASVAYGSNFSLTMPFTIANGTSTNSLTSVSVVLTNAVGSSTAMSAAAH